MSRVSSIGQSVTRAVRKTGLSRAAVAQAASPRAKRAWPHASGLPLIGNTISMMGDLRSYLTEQYLQLGPVFQVRAFQHTFTVLAGPEANLFLLREGKTHLRSLESWTEFNSELGVTRSIGSMDGQEHFRLRRILKDGYSRSYIEKRLAAAIAIAEREIASWPLDAPLPGLYMLQRITTDQLGVLAANTSPREYLDDLIVFIETLLLTMVTRQRPRLLLHAPRVRRARKRIVALYEQVMAAHEAGSHEEREPDLIDDILELHKTDPQFMPETDLMISVLGPYIAGLDTSASTSAFTLYTLLKHPDLLPPMQAEADMLFAGGTPTAPGLRKLDVTHRVVLETLRMYPIAPAAIRTVANSFEFAGYTIPAGTQVIMATTVPHYLPEYFPNPERFDIDRYLPDRAEHRQPGAFAPFGLGSHRCLGSGFAEVQIAVTLATIMHQVELVLDPPDYELQINPAPMPRPAKSFKFKVARRRQRRRK